MLVAVVSEHTFRSFRCANDYDTARPRISLLTDHAGVISYEIAHDNIRAGADGYIRRPACPLQTRCVVEPFA